MRLATEAGYRRICYQRIERAANANFPHPTTFLGDYSGIAASPNGGTVSLWTDMRPNVCYGGRCGTGEDAFFAAAS